MSLIQLYDAIRQARTPRRRVAKLAEAERIAMSIVGHDMTDAIAIIRNLLDGTLSYSDWRVGLLEDISGKISQEAKNDDDIAIAMLLAA